MHKKIIAIALLGLSIWFGVAQALTLSVESDGHITGYEVVLFLHQLLFVFWLGPDLGRYIWSTRAADPSLSPTTRVTAGELINKIELFPRVCISLMLTVGGILTEAVGLTHPWWQMAGIVLLGPVWLSMVLIGHFRASTDLGKLINNTDVLFRLFMAAAILASVSYSWSTGRFDTTQWVAGKLLLFAAIVLFGMLMRIRLRPFDAAIATMSTTGPTEASDAAMSRSLGSARPYIFGIWIALALAAWLGVAQPG
jgi:hypothetical protein